MLNLDLPLPWPTGSTGLCYWNSKIAICLQGGEREGKTLANRIALLEPDKSFAVHSYCELPDYCDPHSLASDEEGLYVAATGKDSIYRATFDGGRWNLKHYWTLPGSDGKKDRNHINGLTLYKERLLTSGFEKKGSGGWESANRGFVYDVTAEGYLMRGINHPHSVIATDEELITCESKESRLVFDSGETERFDLGYLRGLFTDKHYYYVGISKKRRFSKSGDGEKARRIYEGECAIFRLHKKSGKIGQVVDFSKQRNEIYDLLPL